MSAIKSLNINELVEQEKGPIWVLNTSNEKYASGADVFVTLVSNGQASLMTIPRTWLPIELTERHPRKAILESRYFVEALASGVLKAIPKELAEKLLKDSGVEKERERLKMMEDAVAAAGRARGINKNVSISTGDIDADNEAIALSQQQAQERSSSGMIEAVNAAAGKMPKRKSITLGADGDDEEEDDNVSPGFKAWVDKVNAIDDYEDARSEVKMRGNMQLEEAEYLVKNCTHSSIVSTLAKKLAKL